MNRQQLKEVHDAIEAFTDPQGRMPSDTGEFRDLSKALSSLKAALSQPAPQGEQEPVAWLRAETASEEWGGYGVCPKHYSNAFPVYTHPSPSLAELRAKIVALPNAENLTGFATLVYLDEVLAEIDKMGGKV